VLWKVGDFGRFKNEDPKFPRFELISVDKEKSEVTLWYSGAKRPTAVPLATFKEDCENWWNVEILKQPHPPDWLHTGCAFSLDSPHRAIVVTVAQIREKFNITNQSVDVKGLTLQFRRKRFDYLSCLAETPARILLLLPLKLVQEFGRPVTTRWDIIRNLDVIEKEEDFSDLF
jgi:hypothetical protein